jgi:hypothetical protein
MDMALSRMIPLALVGLAVVGLASRAAHGAAPVVVKPAPAVAPAPPAAPAPAPPVVPPADCAPCKHTTCVREKVTRINTVYRCKTKTICLPYCKLCGNKHGGKHGGDCDSGCDSDCGECGKPCQVRVLIKRFVKEEHGSACVPKEVPAAPVCATPVQPCPAPSLPPCPAGRPSCLPAPCAPPALSGAPAPGTVIHGTTQNPQPKGK